MAIDAVAVGEADGAISCCGGNLSFKFDPEDECCEEGYVEEALIGNCENDEGGGKREEDYCEAMKVVVVVGLYVEEGGDERGGWPSDTRTFYGWVPRTSQPNT